MRQHRWLELIKDYNLEIHYHLGKANGVADALSYKSYCHNLMTEAIPPELSQEIDDLRLKMLPKGMLNELRVLYNLEDQIRKAQQKCPKI